MKIIDNIFDALWEHRGGSFGEPGDDYQDFFYSALEEAAPLGMIYAHIPPLSDRQLEDWDELESWLQGIHDSLELSDLCYSDAKEIDFDSSRPIDAFGDATQILKASINMVKRSSEQMSDSDIWVAEIKHGNRTLFLLYDDLDGWALGHSYSVEIAESLDKFTEKNGYFEAV